MEDKKNQNKTERRGFLTKVAGLTFGAGLVSSIVNNIFAKNTKTVDTKSPDTLSSDPFLGQVIMFAGNFAPRGWAFCDGQLLPISSNSALFSLLGTTYGGEGWTTFALPDLRGRAPIHAGRGPGLSERRLGDKGGSETITNNKTVSSGGSNNVQVAADNPDNMQPYLAINYIIALQGTFPSRS